MECAQCRERDKKILALQERVIDLEEDRLALLHDFNQVQLKRGELELTIARLVTGTVNTGGGAVLSAPEGGDNAVDGQL